MMHKYTPKAVSINHKEDISWYFIYGTNGKDASAQRFTVVSP